MLAKFTTLALVGAALAQHRQLKARDDIDADAVVGFAETVPDDTEGDLMLKWQPYLYVVDGCVPFPAVDAEGDTSAGLAPTGEPDGDCSSSTGQVYARAESYNDAYAIMYSWYMPKDEPSLLESLVGIGHRYDWEGIVVWLSDDTEDATLLGVAASYHGDYVTETDPSLSDDHPLIKYYTAYDILDHSCGFTTTVGGMQPLIAWDSMPTVAQEALADKDWGSANVPFIDANFENNLILAEL
ncbi:putative NPP1 domain protein [Xylariales sp. PMI_506]|nr:putative NPP1 domain protein [Xylariales sp. PMI_506]